LRMKNTIDKRTADKVYTVVSLKINILSKNEKKMVSRQLNRDKVVGANFGRQDIELHILFLQIYFSSCRIVFISTSRVVTRSIASSLLHRDEAFLYWLFS